MRIILPCQCLCLVFRFASILKLSCMYACPSTLKFLHTQKNEKRFSRAYTSLIHSTALFPTSTRVRIYPVPSLPCLHNLLTPRQSGRSCQSITFCHNFLMDACSQFAFRISCNFHARQYASCQGFVLFVRRLHSKARELSLFPPFVSLVCHRCPPSFQYWSLACMCL